MQIKLNGISVETPSTDLAALVLEQSSDPSCLVVEHNGCVVKQENWFGIPPKSALIAAMMAAKVLDFCQ